MKDLPGKVANDIGASVSFAKKGDGSYKAENTVTASQITLRRFGAWLAAEGYIPDDPFSMLTDNSPLEITLADDAMDDDCSCPEGCTHEVNEGDSSGIPCEADCPIHSAAS